MEDAGKNVKNVKLPTFILKYVETLRACGQLL